VSIAIAIGSVLLTQSMTPVTTLWHWEVPKVGSA